MSKKGGNFFEEYIDKVILAIIGIVCVWLLVTRVIVSPNVVSYDGKKFSSGDIDNHISEQIEFLGDKLDRKPEPKDPYKPDIARFTALFDSALSEIDDSVYLPQPSISSSSISDKRVYDIPLVGGVDEVSIEHIRTVAYVPTEEISEENFYAAINSEPNDIDFVTVEAKFDIVELYERFYSSFAGDEVKRQWRDPCLAKPIFAAVQLQRQELLADDNWSDWQVVPRAAIDFRKQMFEIVEDIDELPAGGLKVRLLRFDDIQVMMDILQPEAYRIASAGQQWLPPSLHKKLLKIGEDAEAQEKREERAAEKKEREQLRESRRSKSSTTTRTRSSSAGSREPTRRSRRERDVERVRPEKVKEAIKPISERDVYDEFGEILIASGTDFTSMTEPLMFWAYDDTVEPEKSYRYRIRLGVFNPVAGTNKITEQSKALKNKVILWSEFSEATETVEIPGKLYFFPFEVQEAAKITTVRIYRYVLGHWYGKDFTVRVGESIGEIVGNKVAEEKDGVESGVVVPEMIDYTTGAVLVDVVTIDDWSGKKLRARHYFDMLYSFDGMNIERMPIKTRYWSEDMQFRFGEVRKAEKEPIEPLQVWSDRGGRRQGSSRMGGTGEEGTTEQW
ncbi:MAG: hypothetical protein KAS75_00015 [Planctomycetes bacterium]|nr:hypothetical protein [Planctomycetota bacterium]